CIPDTRTPRKTAARLYRPAPALLADGRRSISLTEGAAPAALRDCEQLAPARRSGGAPRRRIHCDRPRRRHRQITRAAVLRVQGGDAWPLLCALLADAFGQRLLVAGDRPGVAALRGKAPRQAEGHAAVNLMRVALLGRERVNHGAEQVDLLAHRVRDASS